MSLPILYIRLAIGPGDRGYPTQRIGLLVEKQGPERSHSMLCYSYSWLGWPLLLYMDMKASYYVPILLLWCGALWLSKQ
jgi:hypothetical protein|uniref:Uncharacterized protein n=1 Tax=Picea glauca TaxID=3330 RepID=A0A101LX33_PICGL|nr:hypothetical protein ABT39_MTgene1450 [Picea glauca]QHR92429.1 hypothetical protein Q903MT_gene6475 [Picea sitchensis]